MPSEETDYSSDGGRKIAISLTDPDFGEQTAQACAKACLQQLLFPV
jgi:hypothetical protein